jgi:hypothetical protein
MKEYNWEDYTDEDIKDEITIALLLLKDAPNNQDLSEKGKKNLIDECLDKLNMCYNEQRKRGTFKRNFGTT